MIHKYYKIDEQITPSCDVCLAECGYMQLFPACADEKCDKVLCLDCVKRYYEKIKKGAYITKHNFECMFCRKFENIVVLKYILEDFFKLIKEKDEDFLKNINDNIYGWCNKCDKIEKIPKGNCRMEDSKTHHLCNDCSIDAAIKTKPCPHCNFRITRSDSKRDGCHHMKCPNCNKYWCWFCLAKLEYTHAWRCAVNGCDNPF
jgi:hypothetical protein